MCHVQMLLQGGGVLCLSPWEKASSTRVLLDARSNAAGGGPEMLCDIKACVRVCACVCTCPHA